MNADKDRTYEVNRDILLAEVIEFEREFFEENAEYCSCDAERIVECKCSSESKSDFRKRMKRKRKSKFRDRTIQLLQFSGAI